MNTLDPNVESVRELLKQRAAVGLKKYGVTTERTDWTRLDRLRHALAEACDLAVYLQAEISIAEKEERHYKQPQQPTPQDIEAYDKWAKGQQGTYGPPPESLKALWEKGREAWKDVPDAAQFQNELRGTSPHPCKCGVEPCICDGEEAQHGVPWWMPVICLLCILSPVMVLVYELWMS